MEKNIEIKQINEKKEIGNEAKKVNDKELENVELNKIEEEKEKEKYSKIEPENNNNIDKKQIIGQWRK